MHKISPPIQFLNLYNSTNYSISDCIENNVSNGWPVHVSEFAENLVDDFDGSLAALATADLAKVATAIGSYEMRLDFF